VEQNSLLGTRATRPAGVMERQGSVTFDTIELKQRPCGQPPTCRPGPGEGWSCGSHGAPTTATSSPGMQAEAHITERLALGARS